MQPSRQAYERFLSLYLLPYDICFCTLTVVLYHVTNVHLIARNRDVQDFYFNTSVVLTAAVIQMYLINSRREFYLKYREAINTAVVCSTLLELVRQHLNGTILQDTQENTNLRKQMMAGMLVPKLYNYGAYVRVHWLLPRLLLRQILWPGLHYWRSLNAGEFIRLFVSALIFPGLLAVSSNQMVYTQFQVAWDRAKLRSLDEGAILDRVMASSMPWSNETFYEIFSIYALRPCRQLCKAFAIRSHACLLTCDDLARAVCRDWFCSRLRSRLQPEGPTAPSSTYATFNTSRVTFTEDMTSEEFDQLCLVCFDSEGICGQWHEQQNCGGRICNTCVQTLAKHRQPMQLPCPFCRRVLPPPGHPNHPAFVELDLEWKMVQFNLSGPSQTSLPNDWCCWLHVCTVFEPSRGLQELALTLVAFVEEHATTFRGLCAGICLEYQELLQRIAR
eukprot:gene5814-7013_t